jgi:hypothetical protein
VLRFDIGDRLITADQYAAEKGVPLTRAFHELNILCNEAAKKRAKNMTAAYDPGPIPASLDRRLPRGRGVVYSYSLLNNYANVCPHQTWRRYVKKDLPYVESAAMKYGNAVHTAMEYRLGGKPLPPEMQQWEPIVAAFDGRGAKAEQKLGITREGKPCGFFDDGVWFRGKIDVTLMEGNTAVIADFKTGSSNYESSFELETNALLFNCLHPHLTRIAGFYIWLKEGRIGQKYDLSDTNSTWQKVSKLVAEIEGLPRDSGAGWEKRKSGLCGWCAVGDCEHHFVAREK